VVILFIFLYGGSVLACKDFHCPILKVTDPPLSGEYIADLQKLLKSAGYYSGEITGCFDAATGEAVKKFEQDQGLNPDGNVGTRTWDALVPLFEKTVAVESEKEGPKGEISILIDVNKCQLSVLADGKVFKTYPVAVGKSVTPSPVGDYKIVHKALNWGTGFGTRWLGLNVSWGIYGIHGTNKPGSIGSRASHGCFRMLNRDVEEIFPWIPIGTRVIIVGYTPKFRGFNRELKPGASGQDVVMLQRGLQELGFSSDPADGRYGALTEFSVKMLEAYHMLQVDGKADMEVLKIIQLSKNNRKTDN